MIYTSTYLKLICFPIISYLYLIIVTMSGSILLFIPNNASSIYITLLKYYTPNTFIEFTIWKILHIPIFSSSQFNIVQFINCPIYLFMLILLIPRPQLNHTIQIWIPTNTLSNPPNYYFIQITYTVVTHREYHHVYHPENGTVYVMVIIVS